MEFFSKWLFKSGGGESEADSAGEKETPVPESDLIKELKEEKEGLKHHEENQEMRQRREKVLDALIKELGEHLKDEKTGRQRNWAELKHFGNGRYGVLKELGQGGMGQVFLVWDRTIGDFKVLKMLKDQQLKGLPVVEQEKYVAQLIERFKREKEIMANRLTGVDMSSLVMISDAVEADFPFSQVNTERLPDQGKQVGLVMEYVRGKGLHDVVDEIQKEKDIIVRDQRILKIVLQLCKALRVLHEKDILHRDVKPGNIIVAENGEVTLFDYGIAGYIGDSSSSSLDGVPKFDEGRVKELAGETSIEEPKQEDPTWLPQMSLGETMAVSLPEMAAISHEETLPAAEVVMLKEQSTPITVKGKALENLTITPVGTPSFMAPEVVKGEAKDRRSDIYSLGCVLHGMISGGNILKVQFRDLLAIQVAKFRGERVIQDLKKPTAFTEVVMSMEENEKSNRPDSAQQVGELLLGALFSLYPQLINIKEWQHITSDFCDYSPEQLAERYDKWSSEYANYRDTRDAPLLDSSLLVEDEDGDNDQQMAA